MKTVLLAALLVLPLGAEDYSRFCKRPGEGEYLRPGTYEGTWEVRYAAVLPMGPRQTLTATGTFRLTVGDSGGSKLTGTMERSTRMQASAGGAQVTQRLEGTGSLSLEGEPSGNTFTAQAQHSASGEIRVAHPMHTASQGQSDSGTDRMEFTATSGDCNGASGTVKVPTLDEALDSMRAGGCSVTTEAAQWQMKRVEDASDRLKRFKDELAQPAPAGIHRTREAEARRWYKLLDTAMQREPQDLHACLHDLWLERVGTVHAQWVSQDTSKLNAWKGSGDWPTLQDHLRRAIETSRGLCLLGLDTCLAEAHKSLWTAIQGALGRHLQRMADGQAPIVDILAVCRSADLLGAVSPGIRDQCDAAVLAQAIALADAAWAEFQVALKAYPKGMMDPRINPSLHRAVRTEKVANLLGANLSRVAK